MPDFQQKFTSPQLSRKGTVLSNGKKENAKPYFVNGI
jgi:hypothetical protein